MLDPHPQSFSTRCITMALAELRCAMVIGRVPRALRLRVAIPDGDVRALATELHRKAHAQCDVANAVNFPVCC